MSTLVEIIRRNAIMHAETPRGASSGRPEHSPLYMHLPIDGHVKISPDVLDAVEEITGNPITERTTIRTSAKARALLNRWAIRTHPIVLEARARNADTLRARQITQESTR